MRQPISPKSLSMSRLLRSSGTRGGRTWSKNPPHSSYTTKSAPRLNCGRLHEGVDDVGHEGLAGPHVAVRVLVARQARPLADAAGEVRIDERDSREGPGRAARVVVGDRARAGEAGLAPQRAHRDVVEEVAVGHAGLLAGGEDRVVGEARLVLRLWRQVVLDQPVGLRGVHVLAVGQGRTHQRAVEAVVGGEGQRRILDEAEVALRVVGDGEDVVVAGAQEAVAPAAVELGAPALPAVVGIGMAAALQVGCPGGAWRASCPSCRRSSAPPGGRRLRASSRGSGRRSGSPSSGRRSCRSGMLRGLGRGERRSWRLAASATSVSESSTVASEPASPAVSAARWRNSRRRRYSSGAADSSRSAYSGSRMSSVPIPRPR